MSTKSRRPRPFSQYRLGFLTNPTGYVVKVYPPFHDNAEIVFVPLLKKGREEDRWEQRWLTCDQYQQIADAIRQIIEPTPACEVRELSGEGEQSTASTAHPGATPAAEVS